MVVLSSSLPQNDGMFSVSPSDHGIKLFGKTIPAPAGTQNAAEPAETQDQFHGECDEDGFSPREVHDELGVSCGSGSGSEDEDRRGFSMNEGKDSEIPDSAEKLQGSRNNSPSTMEDNEKALRRLHKPIPCPRCQSLDTKFCYFNNYNVNQPRHFCKHCQRYWTAGGTLRNVPVGSGKRKCKQSSAPQRYSFASHSVLCRRDDTGEAQSLLSCSRPEQMTKMEPSLQSASHNTICVGKDGGCSSSSVRSHTPLLGTVSSNVASRTEWLQVRRDAFLDFQSHSRDGHTGYSNNTSLKASTTEGTEFSLCSSSDPAPAIEHVSSSNSEGSTFHQSQSFAHSENSSSTQILPVLAGPWSVLYHMYWTQIPIGIPIPTFPVNPSLLPGPFWTVPSTLAPCATANSLKTPTSLGKRPAEESVEGSTPSIPKTSRIHANKASSLPTVGLVGMRPQSSTSTGFSNISEPRGRELES